jgi:hypothetical protein
LTKNREFFLKKIFERPNSQKSLAIFIEERERGKNYNNYQNVVENLISAKEEKNVPN